MRETMRDPTYCVVIPSVRAFPVEYLDPLLDRVAEIIVVDDSNGMAERGPMPKNMKLFTHSDQEAYLPNAGMWIARRNPSCKAFGLYYAAKEKHDIIILLDDDCDTRVTPDFIDKIPIGREVAADTFYTLSGWYNPLGQLGEKRMWARGYPYEYRGEEAYKGLQKIVAPSFNEGLWTGTADINGIDKLNGDEATADRKLSQEYVALAYGQKLPLSIMNVQMVASLVPAFWQPPDYFTPSGFRVRRHDDVWSMYILKTIMDIRGMVATVGAPLVHHVKEGDMHKEMLSEHLTNLVQPYLVRLVDEAKGEVGPGTVADQAHRLGRAMLNILDGSDSFVPGEFDKILAAYAAGIVNWALLFT